MIYARAMVIQLDSSNNMDIKSLLDYELAPVPTSMFADQGNMRDSRSKSVLKNSLKVEASKQVADHDIQATFLDGCAVLWVISWSTGGIVLDYLNRFKSYVHQKLQYYDVYLVFDR